MSKPSTPIPSATEVDVPITTGDSTVMLSITQSRMWESNRPGSFVPVPDGPARIELRAGDEMDPAWLTPVEARLVAAALLGAANQAERMGGS